MKRLTLTTICLFCMTTLFAQDWMDMTDEYVVNPDFNGSTEGWVINYNSSTAQNFGYQGASYYNGDCWISQFAETWRNQSYYYANPLGDGSIHQQIKGLPVGHYTLEADVIAVSQNYNNNPVAGVYLFLANSTSEARTDLYTGDGRPEHFSVEFDTNQTALTLGVRTESTTANWVAFDNVKLYWEGNMVRATELTLNVNEAQLVQGETLKLIPTIQPANTTFKTCTFYSSNPNCASVDDNGLVSALKPGMTTISVYTKTNEDLVATCLVTVSANKVAAEAVIINEIQQANVDMFVDPSFNYGSWIELYNSTDKTVFLDGLYISDDPANLKKFRLYSARYGSIPAKGYLTLWFEHYSWWTPKMVDLELDFDGGTIFIADESGTILSQLDYPPAISRTSYARKTDGGNEWGYTDQPTPDASNATSSFAVIRLEAPEIDTDGCFFTGDLLAQVTNIPAGATLRYTLDGSTPTLENGMTSADGLFSFQETAILRLRYFQDGYLSSPVITRSYIYKDKNYTLPVISIVSDNANLYGNELGIFVRGVNGRPGNGQSSPCNWNMDWDRPTNIEYFTEEGISAFNQEANIEASGGWSRAFTPHSFNIKANKVYEGKNRLDYQFFENKPFLRHKALKVRNGGNDYNNGRIKDAAIQQVVSTSGLYVEAQSYKPVHVFHNGKYIGVENLREPNNKSYGYANYGIDTDDQDQFKISPDSCYVQQAGTRDVFDEWCSLAANASDPLCYERIKEIIDIEEFANYMAVEIYLDGNDWARNNVKAFRERSEGTANSRFRFVLFDLDSAFGGTNGFSGLASRMYHTFDQLYGEQVIEKYGNRISKYNEFIVAFFDMLQNEEFKKQVVDQCCIVAGSVFEPTRSAAVIDDMIAHVQTAMQLEGAGLNSAYDVKNRLTSTRQTECINNMRNYLGLGTSVKVNLSTNIEEGTLLINDLSVPTNKFGGLLFPPITLKTAAPAGYQFLGWKSSKGSSTATTLFAKGSSWYYYDQGSLDGANWTARNYSTTSWRSGKAPLGYFTTDTYNDRGYQTFLDYGGDAGNKYPTYYFRKTVSFSTAPKSDETITLDWIADDGFIVYVNGTEAGRYLMPAGTATFSTFSSSYAPANPESGQMTLDPSLFVKGSNTIAVEVHNNSASSTDIYWDAALIYTKTDDASDYASTNAAFTIPDNVSNVTYTAVYEKLNDNADDAWDAHPVKINEVSAGNDIYVSELFKKSDWIELYNTTDQDYDVNGMFLSDDLTKPEKFQIIGDGNASTVIPPHGHLVIWCDKMEGISQLHADFKLSNTDSSSVLLTAADKSFADTLTYCAHTGYQSVGLFPDGGSSLYVMERPTIGQTNVLTTTALAYDEPKIKPTPIVGVKDVEETSDLALQYKNRTLTLSGASYARVDIYNTAGQLVMAARAKNGTPLSLSALPNGVYIATATTDDEKTILKFSAQ